MKHLFVPYEIALLAKEKGFDEPCLAIYENKELHTWRVADTLVQQKDLANSDSIVAPLYQQLIDWFREKNIKLVEGRQDGWIILTKYDSAYIIHKEVYTIIEALKEAFKLI